MLSLPPDHSQRRTVADEVHARPPEALQCPAQASHLAVLVMAEQRAAEAAHLAGLCQTLGVAAPPPDAAHAVLTLAPGLRLKWERHGEFSGYTVFADGEVAAPFVDTAAMRLPAGWLAAVPGHTLMAGHALLLRGRQGPALPEQLAAWFGAGAVAIGSQVADGAGCAYTDFRVHADGCSRFVLLDDGFTPRQAGRVLQRLFEIEVYRLLALLALPVAQGLTPRLLAIESALAELTAGIARDDGREEALLHELTRLAAEVEQALAASQYRFGACRAYSQLVATRIAELRETRLPGLQTIDEFMARRFSPAVATCATVAQRLRKLSERVAQASSLLATRVGIARERQNQSLLASMDRRAHLQLRLQQTVEGLSVAAIAYYAAGLLGYLAKGAKALGLHLDPDLVVGVALPLLAGAVFMAVRRARRHAHE
ncbi:MAG: DUF3422 domain-containing protein [Proteobacteria bacterium]|nr:DUF3422 domain-containing protein [Pseudomonadota bacterium]